MSCVILIKALPAFVPAFEFGGVQLYPARVALEDHSAVATVDESPRGRDAAPGGRRQREPALSEPVDPGP